MNNCSIDRGIAYLYFSNKVVKDQHLLSNYMHGNIKKIDKRWVVDDWPNIAYMAKRIIFEIAGKSFLYKYQNDGHLLTPFNKKRFMWIKLRSVAFK